MCVEGPFLNAHVVCKICGKSWYMYVRFTLNNLFTIFGSSSANISTETNLPRKWK